MTAITEVTKILFSLTSPRKISFFQRIQLKPDENNFFVNREFIEKGCDRERNFILESSPQLGIFYKTNKLNKNKTKKAGGILEQ